MQRNILRFGSKFQDASIKRAAEQVGAILSPSLDPGMYPLTPYPIGVLLALLPLISQIRKLSLAVWGYAVWTALNNFQAFVNTIIWHDNVKIVVPVWCDIGEYLRYRIALH